MIKMLNFVPGWLWASTLVVTAIGCATIAMECNRLRVELANAQTDAAEARADVEGARAVAASELATAHSKARELERKLSHDATIQRKATDAEITNFSRRADALRGRLRDYAATADAPGATAATCDQPTARGDNLAVVPARIGEQDVAEAQRADTIRLELIACYGAYDRARETLVRHASEIVPQAAEPSR